MKPLKTQRLTLRPWRESDRKPFAKLCADPQVMRYFPRPLTESESNKQLDELRLELDQTGIGVFAVEESTSGEFIGAVGLHRLDDGFPFSPCIEIAWRLRPLFWGKGIAPEAARACIKYAFEHRQIDEIVAMTSCTNLPSQRVMIKLGMQRDAQTFLHPKLPAGHDLQEHVLYRIRRSEDDK